MTTPDDPSNRVRHWTEVAGRDGDERHVGEADDGSLWCPSRTRENLWDRRLSLWRPTHWPFYVRSRVHKQLTWLER